MTDRRLLGTSVQPQPARASIRARPATTPARTWVTQPRFYPNLHPAAAQPVNRGEILRLQQSSGHYAMRRADGRGQLVPNSRYIFVRTTEGDILMHPRFRHPSLAAGKPVLYAGELYFENGALNWWSNGSGHYRPDASHALQANLPMDRFRTYEDVVKRGARPPPERATKADR